LAEGIDMTTRTELDRELDHLECMLPPWLEKLHHGSQLWPQLDVLIKEIVRHSEPADLPHVRYRLARMIRANRDVLERWH